MGEGDVGPLPPPKLVVDDADVPNVPLKSHRRHKHVSELRNALHATSSQQSLAAEDESNVNLGDNSDAHSSQSSLGLRERIAAKLSRPATVERSDSLLTPTQGISVRDSRSQEIQRDSSEEKDLFRWAVMVENQRGVTLLGSRSYSSFSLLPNDPPPFTIPPNSSHNPDSTITPHSLADYQLPDDDWVWVSKAWLVQMSGNGGSVDGYEYNWWFRDKGWRPSPGRLSAGGWVRRRFWVRLMMRPAALSSSTALNDSSSESSSPISPPLPSDGQPLWTNDPEADWARVRPILRDLGSDGRRIALWRHWLTTATTTNVQKKGKQRSEEEKEIMQDQETKAGSGGGLSASRPTGTSLARPSQERDAAIAVLHAHLSDILALFIFPESRHLFLNMLSSMGVSVPVDPEFHSQQQHIPTSTT